MKKFFTALCLLLAACGDSSDVDLKHLLVWVVPVDSRYDYSMDWNEDNLDTTILVPTDDYHIYFFSDAHIGAEADEHESTQLHFDTILSRAESNHIAALVNAGDISTGRSEDINAASTKLKGCNIPTYSVIGNHDLFFDGWDAYKEYIGSSTFFFTVKTPVAEDLIICMDSGNGTFGERQLDWLKNQLKNQRQKYRKCIIVSHNNIFYVAPENLTKAPITTPPVDEVNLLLDLFLRYQVDYYLSGHFHDERSTVLGVTSILSIGACFDGYDFSHYLDMHMLDSLITWTYVGI